MKFRILGIIAIISLLLLGIGAVFSFNEFIKYDQLETRSMQHESLRALYMIKDFWDGKKLALMNYANDADTLSVSKEDERASQNLLNSTGISLHLLLQRLKENNFVIMPTKTPERWSIWTHDSSGGVRGRIISLGMHEEREFTKFMQHNVQFVRRPILLSQEFATIFFEEQEVEYSFHRNKGFVDIYLPFTDSLMIKLSVDRGLFLILRSDWNGTILYLVLFMGITLLLLYVMLEYVVLRRILNISRKIREIQESNDLSLRIPPSGTDELGELAQWLNKMLVEIERFQQKELGKKEVIIEEERRFLQNIIDSCSQALLVMRDSLILKTNSSFRRIFGDLSTLTPNELQEFLVPILDAKPSETICIHQEEERLFFRLDFHTLAEGEKLIALTDISSLNNQLEYLQERAMQDPLTGLLNRNGIFKTLQESFGDEIFGILIFDIDYFKRINDTYGHPVGDKTLKVFADILRIHQNHNSIIGRWGGEEFLLIQKSHSPEELKAVAENVRMMTMEMGFSDLKGGLFHVSVSAGGGIRESGEAFEALYDRVDKNLYEAKERGRNQTVL